MKPLSAKRKTTVYRGVKIYGEQKCSFTINGQYVNVNGINWAKRRIDQILEQQYDEPC